MVWTVYHNPRCSKCRESVALLASHGVQPTLVHYLETPPDLATLRSLLQQLQLPARALLRETEAEFQQLGLDNPALSEEQILTALTTEPRLLQRPIISNGRAAVIGRPAENLLKLL